VFCLICNHNEINSSVLLLICFIGCFFIFVAVAYAQVARQYATISILGIKYDIVARTCSMNDLLQLSRSTLVAKYCGYSVKERLASFVEEGNVLDCDRCLTALLSEYAKGCHSRKAGCLCFYEKQGPSSFDVWRLDILGEMREAVKSSSSSKCVLTSDAVKVVDRFGIGELSNADLDMLYNEVIAEMVKREAISSSFDADSSFVGGMPLWFRLHTDTNIHSSQRQLSMYVGSAKSFLPRSIMIRPIGFISAKIGRPWFRNECFADRVSTMVGYFDRRQVVRDSRLLRQNTRGVVDLELSLHKRINTRWRHECPASIWSDEHYLRHVPESVGVNDTTRQFLRNLVVNVALVRNTLSYSVRIAVRDGLFPWLTIGEEASLCLRSLDRFYIQHDGDIFGTYVNPQRSRALNPVEGYVLLAKELDGIAAASFSIAQALIYDANVVVAFQHIRNVGGFDGTGFRAKEILMDLFSVVELWTEAGHLREMLLAQYRDIIVLGVGPVRTMNFLLNLPFRQGSDMSVQDLEREYLPYFRFALGYMRHTFESYRSRSYLCILYEWCEYQKALQAAYVDGGKTYSPADYEVRVRRHKLARFSESMLSEHRSRFSDMSDALKGGYVDEHE